MELQNKLKYQSSIFPTSRIRYMRIVPSAPSGGAVLNLSINTSQNVLIQIPAMTVHYINKSFLAYNDYIPGQATENHHNLYFTDTLSEFSQLSYGDNIQHELVNLQNVNNYTKGVARVITPLKNIENNDISDLYSLPDPTTQAQRTRRLQPYTPIAQSTFLDNSVAGTAQREIDKIDKELSHSVTTEMSAQFLLNLSTKIISQKLTII